METNEQIIGHDDLILITGAAGFIGTKLVQCLLERGFCNLRCFTRPSSNLTHLKSVIDAWHNRARIEIMKGNLLSRNDVMSAVCDAALIYHLAAGRGVKLVPDAFMNSVVTTRNLLEACRQRRGLKRFVNVSSFSVYSNMQKSNGSLLDESCPVESQPELRGDAYTFAKVKQEEILAEYGKKAGIPYVIVRPGVVYGPGNEAIHGRVGIGTFGVFLHLGGPNTIPLTYVDNCAEAIALAGLKPGIDGEAFNIVDDDLPSSRQFLCLFKEKVKRFRSLYLPHAISFLLCYLWESYSAYSHGQLPPAFNRKMWHVYWKKTLYSNEKLKKSLGWKPKIGTAEALELHFAACRRKASHA